LLPTDDSRPNCFSAVSERLNTVREQLKQTTKDIDEVRGLHSTILSSPTTDQITQDRLDLIMKTIQTNMRKLGAELKDIAKTASDQYSTGQISSTELRMLRHIQESMIVQLRTAYEEFQSSRVTFEERWRSRIQRTLEIAGYNVSEADIDEAIDSGVQIFSKEFAETQSAKLALQDIQQRHTQMVEIEKSLVELRDMFVDLSNMVNLQGEVINRIETRVTIAADNVTSGQKQLASAEKSKKRYNKNKCYIVLVVTVLLAIIIAVLVFNFI